MAFTPEKDREEVLRAIAANFHLEGLVLDEKAVAVLKRHLAGEITEEKAINELLSDLVPEATPASGGGN